MDWCTCISDYAAVVSHSGLELLSCDPQLFEVLVASPMMVLPGNRCTHVHVLFCYTVYWYCTIMFYILITVFDESLQFVMKSILDDKETSASLVLCCCVHFHGCIMPCVLAVQGDEGALSCQSSQSSTLP